MFNLLPRKTKEDKEVVNKNEEKHIKPVVNNTIALDMDYVDAIYDTAQFVFKDNETIASTMSTIAVKVEDDQEDITRAIHKLDNVNEAAKQCKEQLEEVVKSNNTRDESTKESIEELRKCIMTMIESQNKSNQKLISELRSFTKIVSAASEHVSQLNGITEEVRLISLNARIEAARAGNAGRGFAVVAEEIQKLADQSERCTNEFTATLSTINEGAKNNEMALNKSIEEIESGCKELVGYVDKVGEGMKQTAQVFTNTCEELFASLSENIGDTDDITRLMKKLIEAFSENATDIASMCEMQVSQTSSIFEILDLSEQIKEMKMQQLNQ